MEDSNERRRFTRSMMKSFGARKTGDVSLAQTSCYRQTVTKWG